MIIVMRRDAKKEDIEHMIKQVESLKLKPNRASRHRAHCDRRDWRRAQTPPAGIFESSPGVDEVLPVLAPLQARQP